MARKSKKSSGQKKRSQASQFPNIQSDQSHDLQLEVEGSTRRKAPTSQLLEEYAQDLTDKQEKNRQGPRRPSG